MLNKIICTDSWVTDFEIREVVVTYGTKNLVVAHFPEIVLEVNM